MLDFWGRTGIIRIITEPESNNFFFFFCNYSYCWGAILKLVRKRSRIRRVRTDNFRIRTKNGILKQFVSVYESLFPNCPYGNNILTVHSGNIAKNNIYSSNSTVISRFLLYRRFLHSRHFSFLFLNLKANRFIFTMCDGEKRKQGKSVNSDQKSVIDEFLQSRPELQKANVPPVTLKSWPHSNGKR